MDTNEINARIANRDPCTSFEPNTYYTQSLFEHFCDNRDYKHLAIYGFYRSKYDWTQEQCDEIYAKSPDGWTDGLGVYRLYDWGKGENKVIRGDDERDWHEPQFDHIVPRSRGGGHDPSNMQVLPRIINRILSNMTREQAPALLPLVIEQFKD